MKKCMEQSKVYADWIFDERNIRSGSIAGGDLVIADQSGKGNDLNMQSYLNGISGQAIQYDEYISFSRDSMSSTYHLGSKGSISLSPSGSTGVDFITGTDAAINSELFQYGYTIEIIYKIPSFAATAWSSILSRQGVSRSCDDPKAGTMNVKLSNQRAVLFKTADYQDLPDTAMNRDAWSASMYQSNCWYHIAITSDNSSIELYVNGMDTVKGYYKALTGMYADPHDGRFRIGSYQGEYGFDTLLSGNIERIRLTRGVLDKKDWLIPDPIKIVQPKTPDGNLQAFSMADAGNNYNIVFIPDTQVAIQGKLEVLDTATDWLVQHAEEARIAAVLHLGDITESNSGASMAEEWENARNSFYKLADRGFKTLMVLGNHDSTAEFINNLGPGSAWANLMEKNNPGLVIYEPNVGISSAMLFEAGSYTYMVISIGFDRETAETDLPWMQGMLDNNPGIPTIIISHDLLSGALELSKPGDHIWKIAKRYDQVFMMVGGHYFGNGYSILTNNAGNEVIAILMNYQDQYMGGNAWFKFAEFAEKENKIYLKTFSPYVASKKQEQLTYFDRTYLEGRTNDDVFSINFSERFNF